MPLVPTCGLGRILVLDIESATDPYALALSGRRGRVAETSAALHLVTDVSMLAATERRDGSWDDISIFTVSGGQDDEPALLRKVDSALQSLRASKGTLVTYNGAHDLTILNRRCARHLIFDMTGISFASEGKHFDPMTMRAGPKNERWAKLKDVAAGLGVPTTHQLHGRGMSSTTGGVAKSQTDVAMTFIVMLYELAMLRRDAGPVMQGWRALGSYIDGMGPHGEHLAQFRRHPLGRPPNA
jgi:hypothetical protein